MKEYKIIAAKIIKLCGPIVLEPETAIGVVDTGGAVGLATGLAGGLGEESYRLPRTSTPVGVGVMFLMFELGS